MIPGVRSSVAALFDTAVEPSPPPLPLAQTVTMPALARASCKRLVTGESAPHDRLTTLIGGHTSEETPRPHGAAWCRKIQANPLSVPMSAVVAEIMTTRAPGADPPAFVPSVSVTL